MLLPAFRYHLLRIRTNLNHRPHELRREHSVFVGNLGFLALLFLRNNLHVFQCARPTVPWQEFPKLFRANREWFLGEQTAGTRSAPTESSSADISLPARIRRLIHCSKGACTMTSKRRVAERSCLLVP